MCLKLNFPILFNLYDINFKPFVIRSARTGEFVYLLSSVSVLLELAENIVKNVSWKADSILLNQFDEISIYLNLLMQNLYSCLYAIRIVQFK